MSTLSEHSVHDDLGTTSGRGMTLAIVRSCFNNSITEKMLHFCTERLQYRGVSSSQIFSHQVSGALEIPTALLWSFKHHRPDAMIALGCVIRGETYHFEVVADQSARSLMELSSQLEVAIANGILTCENESQALARCEIASANCADTAISMALLKNQLQY